MQDHAFIQRQDPQLQVQTEAELSLDEIREREAAIRQLEVKQITTTKEFIFYF